ncbi:hypothetical protein DL96DRAFT_1714191 [Flagelloscypha sp. PMI_526]|nr:hypothetical protein DL96DRAFT_1714191 [Flagelloscypha sp. PMI_526]
MPRPILKRGGSPPALEADVFPFAESSLRHVAFPLSPSELVKEHAVHSPRTYDRSPIVVDRRYSCAMPERGCPGRTYRFRDMLTDDDQDDHTQLPPSLARYHPSQAPAPPCPDLCSSSSESDESSDGFASPPPEPWVFSTSKYQPFPEDNSSYISTTPTQERPLSFLPHPNPHAPPLDDIPTTPTRRSLCRSTKELSKRTSTPKPKANRKSSPSKAICRAMAGLGFKDDNEDGCLGGF